MPVMGEIAKHCGQSVQEMQRRLASAEGQKLLLKFFSPKPALPIAARLASVSLKLMVSFVGTLDLGAAMAVDKVWKEYVTDAMVSRCSTLSVRSDDMLPLNLVKTKFAQHTRVLDLRGMPDHISISSVWPRLYTMSSLQRVIVNYGAAIPPHTSSAPFVVEVSLRSAA